MVEIETRCRILIWRTFGRIQLHVILEPPATLQGVRISSAILKIIFRHILFYFFWFFNIVWALTSSGFRIVSDTLVFGVATSSYHQRRKSLRSVHVALLSLGGQRGMRYLHHYATTNYLPGYFVASWRLNYTLEHIIHTSTLVTVFTVRVGEHNFIVLTCLLIQFSIQKVKKFLNWLRTSCVVSMATAATWRSLSQKIRPYGILT